MSPADDSSVDMKPTDILDGFDPLMLDDGTAERMLDGRVLPDDAPPPYRAVAALVAALQSDATPQERDGDASIVGTLAAIRANSPRRSTMRRKIMAATAATVGSLALLGGVAAAGALPDGAQGVASDVLGAVGVSVPGPNSHSTTHPADDATGAGAAESPTTPTTGNPVSDLARTTTATGVDKGAEISTLASGGKSQAGEHGAPSSAGAPSDAPPESLPASGTPTADTASGGRSGDGTTIAGDASGGHSTDGSGNATAGLTHRP